jgi:hypothetical protein
VRRAAISPKQREKSSESGYAKADVTNRREIGRTLKRALEMQGPVVMVYRSTSDNHRLLEMVHPNVLN